MALFHFWNFLLFNGDLLNLGGSEADDHVLQVFKGALPDEFVFLVALALKSS